MVAASAPLSVDIMLSDIVLLGLATLLSVLEQGYFVMKVYQARRKYKVSPPAMNGPPEFDRISRAQINSFEYYPMFLTIMWTAGVFQHQVPAFVIGLGYLAARFKYFHGYAEAAELRVVPLRVAALMLWILVGLAAIGIGKVMVYKYAYKDILRVSRYLMGN